MSYTRDKDAYTRGAGAIASVDYGNARRARERRAKIRRFEADDRMLSRFTMGARGGIGAIDQVKLGVDGRPTLQQGGNVESPTGGQVGGGRVPTPTKTSGGNLGTGFAYQQPAVQYGIQGQPGYAISQPVVQTWVDPGPDRPGLEQGTGPLVYTAPGPQMQPTTAGGMSSSTKKWLLIAALVGGGTYLYLKNKRSGG